jgi:hypothetical protein
MTPRAERRGNAPALLERSGSRHASLWVARCLDCDDVAGRARRLISAALADLAWHQEMHRVWRRELGRAA